MGNLLLRTAVFIYVAGLPVVRLRSQDLKAHRADFDDSPHDPPQDFELPEEPTLAESVVLTTKEPVLPPTEDIPTPYAVNTVAPVNQALKHVWPGASVNSQIVDYGLQLNDRDKVFFTTPVLPDVVRWGQRVFDKSEVDYVEKYYVVEILTDGCASRAQERCPKLFGIDNRHAEVRTDRLLRDCILNLEPECQVQISGFWNYTKAHPPQICLSHSIGIRLPSPGGVVPRADCVYERLQFWNLAIKHEVWSDISTIMKRGTGEICSIAVGPHWKYCRAGIEWGKNVPTADCRRRDIEQSIVMEAYTQWEFTEPKEDWSRTGFNPSEELAGDPNRESYEGRRVNLRIDFEATRYDRDADGFVWSEGDVGSAARFDTFFGADLPFICTSRGQKGVSV